MTVGALGGVDGTCGVRKTGTTCEVLQFRFIEVKVKPSLASHCLGSSVQWWSAAAHPATRLNSS